MYIAEQIHMNTPFNEGIQFALTPFGIKSNIMNKSAFLPAVRSPRNICCKSKHLLVAIKL